MKSPKAPPKRLIKRLAWLLAASLVFAGLLCVIFAGPAAGTAEESSAWANPGAKTLKRISPIDTAQHEPNFLNNLDCTLTEYRLVTGKTMQTGCFTPTAFGLLDSDSDTVIFNGTDEALPLLPHWPGQVLVPWPNALDMIVLEATATGGSYVKLYKNPLATLQDQRNALLQLTGKRLTAPPDLIIRDAAGRQLVVNPQTLAFSDSGSWLVLETLNGSFVRINLATLDVTAFAPAYAMQGSPALFKSQVTVSDDGRYVAIANDAGSALKVYDLTNCGSPADGSQSGRCASYDYFPFARQQIKGLQGVRHLRFVNESLLSFEARTTDPDSGGIYELAPRESIGPLIDYLALGDSYTSGEGAFNYLAGTDTPSNTCHLSANSYPLLLTRALFSSSGGHSVACSGAVINDIGSDSRDYRGQVKDGYSFEELQRSQTAFLNSIMANYLPGYVAQQRFVKQYQPAVMTVSIGGIDIGFGGILAKCVAPRVSLRPSGNDCYDTYEDRLELTNLIDRTVPRWARLYGQLAATAPGSRIYAVGYPQVAAVGGNCALNVHMSQSELAFAEELTDYLNDHIRQAAVKGGVIYVDISQALAGHRMCETAGYNVAVNGLTAGGDFGVFGLGVLGRESYHPNALGHSLIEQAILEQTHNFTAPAGAFIGNTGQTILSGPKSGRAVNRLIPVRLTDNIIRPGKTVSIKAGGSQNGLKARTAYTIRLGGANGTVIGTTVSNDSGDIDAEVTPPENAVPGGQTIDVTGENQTGEPVDLTQPVYVPVSDHDADGDGIADTADSCPAAVNSGQDVDHDGIDDTCDGSVGPPPLVVGQGDSGSPGSGPASGSLETTNNPGSGSLDATNGLSSGAAAVVTNFGATSENARIAVARLAGRLNVNPIKAGRVARALGAATINPATVARANIKFPGQPRAAGPAVVRALVKLRVISWLPWALLLIALWLLLLLSYFLSRTDRLKRYPKHRFSITMDA